VDAEGLYSEVTRGGLLQAVNEKNSTANALGGSTGLSISQPPVLPHRTSAQSRPVSGGGSIDKSRGEREVEAPDRAKAFKKKKEVSSRSLIFGIYQVNRGKE